MIVDSSALIAIILREPEASDFTALLLEASRARISAANYMETAIVADARAPSPKAADELDRLMSLFAMQVVDVTRDRAELARVAYRRFGKGYHKARLNFGDCFAYALAQEMGEPLLFKGDDFVLTDVKAAI